MTKKTILILNWRLPTDPRAGGAERVTLKHAIAWVQAGNTVIWLAGSPTGRLLRYHRDGIQYLALGPTQLFFLFAGVYRWILVRGSVDCIIDEIHGFPAWSVLWAPFTPKIAFIHEVALEIWDVMYSFPINIIGKFVERWVFPFFYQGLPFWVDAPSVATELSRIGVPKKSIHVIPCAVDVPSAAFISKRKENVFTLVILSRIVAMKGIAYAIDTFIQIKKKIPTSKLWIVGDGDPDYIAKQRSTLAKHGVLKDVIFWGKVSEQKKYNLLSKAHILLHTSVREGFGLTILEAEHAGTPCATFNVSGLQDLVRDGENGIQVPFPDTSKLANSLIRLKSNPETYTTLRKNALRHVREYTWTRFVEQSIQLVESQIQSKE